MTVKIYAAKDSEGREWGPDYAHEMESIILLLRRLWRAYHHLAGLYCVIANVKAPNADLIVVTERGLGVLELKNHSGAIRLAPDGKWMAGNTEIKGGTHGTPHLQVQSYGRTLRQKWLPLVLAKDLKRRPELLDKRIKFQTAVCFTHPDANVAEVRAAMRAPKRTSLEAWESDCTVLKPEEVTSWVATLRFEADLGRDMNFEPFRIAPELLTKSIDLILGATPWTEILQIMPTAQPYGFLYFINNGERQVFNLVEDEIVVGRDLACSIVIPAQFKRVSNRHCKIIRTVSGAELHDSNSRNGTFVEGRRVTSTARLKHGQRITLGGPLGGDKNCSLVFESFEQASLQPLVTEIA